MAGSERITRTGKFSATTLQLPFFQRLSKTSVNRLKLLILSFIVSVACILLFLYNPANSGLFPPCPFYKLTGFYCPGCGSLRGLHKLLHGHIIDALDFNPLMVLSLPFIGFHAGSRAVEAFTSRPVLPGLIIHYRLIRWLPGIIIAYWILRNLPFYPFTILAP